MDNTLKAQILKKNVTFFLPYFNMTQSTVYKMNTEKLITTNLGFLIRDWGAKGEACTAHAPGKFILPNKLISQHMLMMF